MAPAEESVAELAERMAGPGAPAAGTAAAVTTALAAALVAKVAGRSVAYVDDAEATEAAATRWRERALELAGADEAAVAAMLAGGAGPAAIAVPREIGELASLVASAAERLASAGDPRLRADAVTAHRLAEAAQRAVEAILRSNRS